MRLLCLLLVAIGICLSQNATAVDKKKPVRPPTKRTQVIRPETFKKMEAAQKAFDAKDYAGALTGLDSLKDGYDKLNTYEKAMLWSLYSAVHYAKGNPREAIADYRHVLEQPDLPEGLRDNSLYALAQLYFIVEDYDQTIAVIRQWMKAVSDPQPDGFVLLAQTYYQRQDYKNAEQYLIQAMRLARDKSEQPKENWLALLRATYYETKQYAKSAKVLEILVSLYPDKDSYWQQLAGMYGLLERQKDELRIMHAAFKAGLLTKENDLLNLARLYIVHGVPYSAVGILTSGMRARTITASSENLQLLAQALGLAKEYEKQIPVLKKVAEVTGEAKHYVYLGQACGQLAQWSDAAEAFEAALKAKHLEKPADVQVQLGTALYNANKLAEARDVFAIATQSPSTEKMATNWVKFVGQEIQRKNALRIN